MRDVSESLALGYAGKLPNPKELRRLCRFTPEEAAAACLVSPETYRRWERDRPSNRTAVRLLAILAGYVPWPGWEAWEVHRSLLFPPGYKTRGIGPGHIYSYPFERQLLSELRREVAALRARLEVALQGGSGAARGGDPQDQGQPLSRRQAWDRR